MLKPLTQVPDNILVNMLLQRIVKVFGLPMSHEAFDAETLSVNVKEVTLVYEFPIDNVQQLISVLITQTMREVLVCFRLLVFST